MLVTYSIPENPVKAPHDVPVQQPLPFNPSPNDALLSKPSVPTPRTADLGHGFHLTTHVIPAACPRSFPHTPNPPHPTDAGKDVKDPQVIKDTIDELRRLRASFRGQPVELDHTPQWLCVNRYWRTDGSRNATPRMGRQPITMVFIPGGGMTKETWEPTIRHLIQYTEDESSSIAVDEFWCWENTQHGDTAILNEGARVGAINWHDDTRDINQFMAFYMPEHASHALLPTHLDRVPDAVAADRLARGFKHRPMVTVAHSYGGCLAALSAINQPALHPTLVLVDPIIGPVYHPVSRHLASVAIARHDHWPSREVARDWLARSPSFKTWDPAVFDLYVECGLRDDRVRGGVTTKISRMQEALIYADDEGFSEAWQRLPDLPDSVQLHWIMPGKFHGYAMNKAYTQSLVWRRPNRATNIRLPGSAHMIPSDMPQHLACYDTSSGPCLGPYLLLLRFSSLLLTSLPRVWLLMTHPRFLTHLSAHVILFMLP